MLVSRDEFAVAWQWAKSVEDAALRADTTVERVKVRAARWKKIGMRLRDLPETDAEADALEAAGPVGIRVRRVFVLRVVPKPGCGPETPGPGTVVRPGDVLLVKYDGRVNGLDRFVAWDEGDGYRGTFSVPPGRWEPAALGGGDALRLMPCSKRKFVRVWESSGTLREASRRVGMTRRWARAAARHLRRSGVTLKPLE